MAKQVTNKTYTSNLLNARHSTNSTQDVIERKIQSILKHAYSDINRILEFSDKDTVSYINYASKRAGIARRISEMSSEINKAMQEAIASTASNVSALYSNLNKRYLQDSGFQYNASIYNTVPENAISNVLNRVWQDGFSFSSRIWRMEQYAKDGVTEILSKGIARGQSAVGMSRDLRTFMVDDTITPGIARTTSGASSITGTGTINGNALRLAITEINNSYREALVISNARNPITLGVRWMLSGQHKIPDVCDLWAKLDSYGFGAGIYPAGKAPIDHPYGHCTMIEVLRKVSEWGTAKPDPNLRNLSGRELSAPLGTGLTESQKRQAIKMYHNTNELISQSYFAAAA